jgi:hypothetical protein
MPTPPLVATPAKTSPATCATCGDTLIRTGKPVTFAEMGALPSSRVELTPDHVSLVRGQRAFRGWVPALLVAICPTCDGHKEDEPSAAPVATEMEHPLTEPEVDAVREAYLNRLDPGRNNIGGES